MPSFSKPLAVFSLLITCWSCHSTLPSHHSDTSTSDPPLSSIHWRDWDEAAFELAQVQDKLILLDLTAVWCHACHVMEATTYVDPSIVSTVNSRFIPIRVDTDERPDIEARYRQGGWPTTSILLPTGEIVFQGNFLEPAELRLALADSDSLYRKNKKALLSQAAKIWKAVETAKKVRTRSINGIEIELVEQMATMIAENFDKVNGGFHESPKFFEPEAIDFLFARDHVRQDGSWKQMALLTLEQQRNLIDPVWGGFYRYAENADWTNPHYEKMLHLQALNLENYVEAYQVTGQDRYRAIIEQTLAYIERFLLDEEGRGFFASQDADITEGTNSHRMKMSGEEYFRLDMAEREKVGIPPVDQTIYTGWNGMMIKSWLKVYQVLGDQHILESALGILRHLYHHRYEAGKGMAHRERHGQPQTYGLLGDQVAFAMALLEASLTTGDMSFSQKAEQLTNDLITLLEDKQGGGLYDRPVDASAEGLLKFPHKSLEENLRAVILLSDLFYVTENRVYREAAERTLQYVLGSSHPLPLGLAGRAIDRFLRYPVHIVVVGSSENKKTVQLFKEALKLYAPGKVIRLLVPGVHSLNIGEITFPEGDVPQAYVCTEKLCSDPVFNSDDLPFRYKNLVELSK